MQIEYKYRCDDCTKEFNLKRPIEEHMFRVHESCSNNKLVFIEKIDTSPTCSSCEEKISGGYVFHDGEEYYCTNECLQTKYTMKEYNNAFQDGQAYWTTWFN